MYGEGMVEGRQAGFAKGDERKREQAQAVTELMDEEPKTYASVQIG